MNEKTLRVLEFNKIIDKLSSLASSNPGKEHCRKLLPINSLEKVRSMLKETDDGVSFLVRKGSPPLSGIHDISDSLLRVAKGSVLNPGELLRIADVLRAVRNLKSYSSDGVVEEDGNTVKQLIHALNPNRRIEDRIRTAIISEEEISDEASRELAHIRRRIRELQSSIKDKLNELIKSPKYQKYMQEPLVTMRGDRYVIPVKQEYRSEIPGLVHDSSASGATIFIEPMSVVETNNNIKQFKIKEQIEIEKILQELTNDVSTILEELKSNASILAKIDFIFAKAKLSVDYTCVCPKINNQGKIFIKKGRHPLLDRKSAVPIDFWVGDGFNALIVTGPNTGGKTVTLKTVGLFTLMAQAGLHVPAAEGTALSVFENVFADIGDEQSIEQNLSTFSSHMTNIVSILREASAHSLVLLDELGAGTDPTEGAALAIAILENLRKRGAVTVATTHYSELKMYAITNEGVENASCEFDVKTLQPTYRLLIGVPGKSNAFAISKRLGLDDEILENAKHYLSREEIQFEDVMISIEKNRRESEEERIRAEKYRAEAERLKNELEKQRQKLEAQKERILREAREKAKRILLDAKHESEEIIENIKKIQAEREAKEQERALEEARLKLRNKLNTIQESLAETVLPKEGYMEPPKDLKPGDTVLIVNLGQKGTVIAPPDKEGEVLVQAGIIKINVHLTNLKLIDEQKIEVQKMGTGKLGKEKVKSISTEIDLRGLMLDEAISVTDKFIDDASIAALGEVTIIHGKGTGVLRSGIHQFLKKNPHVKSFRLGTYGEGDAGVTVVELK